jgi:L-fucose mutarotase/ribose pyranase (RbsD/FucU family)
LLQEALQLAKEYEPIERRLRTARKEGLLSSDYLGDQIPEAEKAQVISKAEARNMRTYHEKVLALLDVDDFAPEELARNPAEKTPPTNEKVTAKATRKSTTKKKSNKKVAKKAAKKSKKA